MPEDLSIPRFARKPDGTASPINVDADGNLKLAANVSLAAGDIQIGAVELKDANTDQRAAISAAGAVSVDPVLSKGAGNADANTLRVITAANGPVNMALGAPADAEATGDGSIIAILKRVRTVIGSVLTALQGVLTVGGVIARPSANFARPADTNAYALGDLVANSTTAGSVAAMQFTVARVAAGTGMIRRVRLRKTGTSVTNASFRLHLYSAAPTASNGDNGAWLTNGNATYIGAFDVTCDRAFTDGAGGNGIPKDGSEINFVLASGQVIFGLLEARAAYTPANAEVFTVDLEVLQN